MDSQTKDISVSPKTEISVSSPSKLLELAISQNVDIDKLERLMDMQRQWEERQAEKAFYQAMSQFQANLPDIKRDKTADVLMKSGGKYKYKYATLSNIQRAIGPALSDAGLSYRWAQEDREGGKIKVTCHVSHFDGHTVSVSLEASSDDSGGKNSIQGIGSTVSYLRRYTLTSALGIGSADEDTDAPTVKDGREPLSADRMKVLIGNIREGKIELISEALKYFTLTEQQISQINTEGFKVAVERFQTGDLSMDDIKKHLKLTKSQKSELEKLVK